MRPGKVPRGVLEILLDVVGDVRDESVILGPGEGLDAAVIDLNGKRIVVTSDPITGAGESAGFYVVHVNANDVAVLGAKPRWMLLTLMLPEGRGSMLALQVEKDAKKAAEELGITIVGGHSEVTPGLKRLIVSGTMIGIADGRLVLPNGARPGDDIIMTKWGGLEGTSIIAIEKRNELTRVFGLDFVRRAIELRRMISVVKEALKAAELGANAMHDPTEGGVSNGLHEMADASGVGFRVNIEKVPFKEETLRLCEFYGLNPFALISSGTLLIASPKEESKAILRALRDDGINATVVGEFTKEGERLVIRDGHEEELRRPESDEIWKVVD